MKEFKASVIISTYNQPKWLEKVLWSYEQQRFKDFEIIIADDGSNETTQILIQQFISNSQLDIVHVWQEDDGFQKTKILNKAILKSRAGYLIFTDGDCMARADFVERHIQLRRPKSALSGGYFKLNAQISEAITKNDIVTQNCFSVSWLVEGGQPKHFKMNKLIAQGKSAWMLNTFTPTKATFDGMNASVWKQDALAVNGFDERMQYGGEDREFGERLMNYGIKFLQARYSLVCLHLHHERPYKNEHSEAFNKAIRKDTKKNRTSFTNHGINKPNS
ncbi:glycosyltransferase family 2 protein [Sediminibacter sp. Hel_I_10]|uniref:glycosyltransferase family 2 protein n=1 Tax=Sediminibacter sp. Hel_I_10 TaxID=1392490 RepID=UPI00047EFA5C|nr:glycosyltransferase family 2 protein [Sediminibacter sp. Hel_I_10]